MFIRVQCTPYANNIHMSFFNLEELFKNSSSGSSHQHNSSYINIAHSHVSVHKINLNQSEIRCRYVKEGTNTMLHKHANSVEIILSNESNRMIVAQHSFLLLFLSSLPLLLLVYYIFVFIVVAGFHCCVDQCFSNRIKCSCM